jgi:hypothetical protein
MKFFSKHLYRVILIVSCSLPLTAQAALPDFTEIVDRSKDSVVNISTKAKVE